MGTIYRKQFIFMMLLVIVVPGLLLANLILFATNANNALDQLLAQSSKTLASSFALAVSPALDDPTKASELLKSLKARDSSIGELTLYKNTDDVFATVASTNNSKELDVLSGASANQAWHQNTTTSHLETVGDGSSFAWVGIAPVLNIDGTKSGLLVTKIDTSLADKYIADSYLQSFIWLVIGIVVFYIILVSYFITMRYVSNSVRLRRKYQNSDTLISEVASGFQLPISNINNNYAALLSAGYDHLIDEQGETYLQGIYNHANNLAHIVKDLLELNRILSNETSLAMTHVDPVPLLRGVEIDLESAVRNRSVHIIHTPPDHNVAVKADPVWLKRIVRTLLGLALQRMNGGTLSIQYESSGDAEVTVVISSDTYVIHDHSNSLERNFREVSETDYFSQLGVSYWVDDKIAHQMGGSLQVKMQMVQGIVFRLTLASIGTQPTVHSKPAGELSAPQISSS